MVYEWEQDLNEVDIFITPPDFVLSWYHDKVRKQHGPSAPLAKIRVTIKSDHVEVGVIGNPPYMKESLRHLCDAD